MRLSKRSCKSIYMTKARKSASPDRTSWSGRSLNVRRKRRKATTAKEALKNPEVTVAPEPKPLNITVPTTPPAPSKPDAPEAASSSTSLTSTTSKIFPLDVHTPISPEMELATGTPTGGPEHMGMLASWAHMFTDRSKQHNYVMTAADVRRVLQEKGETKLKWHITNDYMIKSIVVAEPHADPEVDLLSVRVYPMVSKVQHPSAQPAHLQYVHKIFVGHNTPCAMTSFSGSWSQEHEASGRSDGFAVMMQLAKTCGKPRNLYVVAVNNCLIRLRSNVQVHDFIANVGQHQVAYAYAKSREGWVLPIESSKQYSSFWIEPTPLQLAQLMCDNIAIRQDPHSLYVLLRPDEKAEMERNELKKQIRGIVTHRFAMIHNPNLWPPMWQGH